MAQSHPNRPKSAESRLTRKRERREIKNTPQWAVGDLNL